MRKVNVSANVIANDESFRQFETFHVISSNLNLIAYDVRLSVLRVRFNSGATYEYSDVPAWVFGALLHARDVGNSVGEIFDRHIKKAGYAYMRISQ